jgi:hypothetical protein
VTRIGQTLDEDGKEDGMVAEASIDRRTVQTIESTADGRYRKGLTDLLEQEHYSAEELADLLEVDVNLLDYAASIGELSATRFNHHILDIRRDDVLHWLADPN